jgi:peptide/nickel transport system permease protein
VLPYTIELAVAGMLLALLFALPIGMAAAVKRGTWVDTGLTVVSLGGLSIPIMLLGPLLLFVFFVTLGWPPGPMETGLDALILPAFGIAVHLMAMLARMTRTSMIEVLSEDYVRTARAKGLPERRVLIRHALRNAVISTVAVLGVNIGYLVGGTLVIEQVFALPGVGQLMINSIFQRDFPVVQGVALVFAVLVVLVYLITDIVHSLLDPRVRFE